MGELEQRVTMASRTQWGSIFFLLMPTTCFYPTCVKGLFPLVGNVEPTSLPVRAAFMIRLDSALVEVTCRIAVMIWRFLTNKFKPRVMFTMRFGTNFFAGRQSRG
jgi:hypothetical protein